MPIPQSKSRKIVICQAQASKLEDTKMFKRKIRETLTPGGIVIRV
jgi:hypothetical protein